MEKKKPESLKRILARVIERAERRDLGAGPCEMSDNDKALVIEAVKLYLTTADFACLLADRVTTNDRLVASFEKAIAEADLLLAALPWAERAALARLRDRYVIERDRWKMPEAERKRSLEFLAKWLDTAVDPLTPLAQKVTRYCLKLGLAEEACHRALDALDDLTFARQIRTEAMLAG